MKFLLFRVRLFNQWYDILLNRVDILKTSGCYFYKKNTSLDRSRGVRIFFCKKILSVEKLGKKKSI